VKATTKTATETAQNLFTGWLSTKHRVAIAILYRVHGYPISYMPGWASFYPLGHPIMNANARCPSKLPTVRKEPNDYK
jgi:hypothetical protein